MVWWVKASAAKSGEPRSVPGTRDKKKLLPSDFHTYGVAYAHALLLHLQEVPLAPSFNLDISPQF